MSTETENKRIRDASAIEGREKLNEIIRTSDAIKVSGGPLLSSWDFDGKRLYASWVDDDGNSFDDCLDIDVASQIGVGRWMIDGETVEFYRLDLNDSERDKIYMVVDDLGKFSQEIEVTPFWSKKDAERQFVDTVNQVLVDEGWIKKDEEAKSFEEAARLVMCAINEGMRGEIGIVEKTI